MDRNLLVSVIIPTYSRPDNITRAIESVLNQTYTPIEIIVVDDNGEGTPYQLQTEEILKQYIDNSQITYIKHKENRNGSVARNTGLKNSHGQYVNFLDDDDVFAPDKISKQVYRLSQTHDSIGACFCNTKLIYKHHVSFWCNSKEGKLAEDVLCGKAHFNTSTVLFKREAIENIKGFDETFRRHQDWELYVRFFRKYEMVNACKDPLLVKYVTQTSVITANPIKQIDYREKFLNTFKDDIEIMSQKRKVYKYQYLELANLLMFYKERKLAFSYIKKAYSYSCPNITDLKKNVVTFLKSYII